jgi:hypothetical protein
MSLGPVQVLVVGYEAPTFSGEVLDELERLREAGIVRLIDVLLVMRTADGVFETLPVPEGHDPGMGRVTAALLDAGEGVADARADGGAADDMAPGDVRTWSLEEAIPPGTTAAVALLEHVWAGPLRAAVGRSGGVPLDETWLDPDDAQRLAGLMQG